jgi:hypothetical protein
MGVEERKAMTKEESHVPGILLRIFEIPGSIVEIVEKITLPQGKKKEEGTDPEIAYLTRKEPVTKK